MGMKAAWREWQGSRLRGHVSPESVLVVTTPMPGSGDRTQLKIFQWILYEKVWERDNSISWPHWFLWSCVVLSSFIWNTAIYITWIKCYETEMKPLMDKRKHESNGSNTELGSQETRAVLPDLATDSSWETVRNSLVSKLLLILVWNPLFLRLWSFWALRPEFLNATAASSGGCEHTLTHSCSPWNLSGERA